jgi:hypothetical protein
MGAQEKGLNGAGNIVGVEIGRHQANRACVIRRFDRADLSGPLRPALHLLCNGHLEILHSATCTLKPDLTMGTRRDCS